ncbi:MAG: 2-amino-4-hydroxy-6-hydroxymethyldihydropteridine diphosphokinase [Muribaculaceae bacterium]|nr:2-amino-4-hydroxy-6-hydroxymethyldihydropteridine diphosphokinase [Muribaculaceae bacterium]
MSTVHLNIGSNTGDRPALIERAIVLIGQRAGEVTARSSVVESPPWGFESSHSFINVGINIETMLSPLGLLDVLQEIEREVSPLPHRNPDGSYRDRGIDIDIIAWENKTVTTDRLTVPHPRARERDFVMIPLREIWQGDF